MSTSRNYGNIRLNIDETKENTGEQEKRTV